MAKKPRLEVVKPLPANCLSPPRKLGRHGMTLWSSVQAEHRIRGVGCIELLALACEALDRAESLREEIDDGGQLIDTKSGVRDNPCLRHELSNRAFVARTLARLGITDRGVKRMGRPSHGFGLTFDDDDVA